MNELTKEIQDASGALFQSVFITVKLYKTLLMGQGLSALISGTAVTSQYLASIFYLNTPMLQSFINCTLLGITYTVALIFRRGDGNILHILKTKWWKYLLLGLTDVEANYAVVKAYQYTTLTSIQLLDCFIIPVLMILSWFFLKTRYRIIHYVAVCTVYVWLGWEPWWERISLLAKTRDLVRSNLLLQNIHTSYIYAGMRNENPFHLFQCHNLRFDFSPLFTSYPGWICALD
uniref:Info solute carrier family 35 member F2, like n=1 Tax=Cyprinus carpio TaxID=7962 RepID=A0A8C2K2K5_CYPCA